MELLIQLASREGQLVTRSEIADRLWAGEVFVDTEHGINTAIRKLRYLLRDDPDDPRFIQTVIGMGYRFIAPITTVQPQLSEVSASVDPLQPEEALVSRQLRQLQIKSKSQFVSPFDQALLYAQRGNREQTFALIDQSFRKRIPDLGFLQCDPEFDFLHADPLYLSLIQRIGLPAES